MGRGIRLADQYKPPVDAPATPSKTLDSFDGDPDNRTDHLSEEEALQRLSDRFDTPNNYLPTPFVHREYGSKFAGWSRLPGAVEEGDRVDGRFDRDVTDACSEFLFAAGDTFRTREGDCRVVRRYHAWLTPWLDRSPIRPRTVYDVEIAGEARETVRQRRIVDDWYVLADSLNDPVPNVDGRLADMAGDATDKPIDFDIGDIVEIDSSWDDRDSCYWKITRASLSYGLLLCQFEPVGPTDHAEPGLAIEEFADDVVEVHNELPTTEWNR